MTGPEHYRAAERLLSDASFTSIAGTPVTREGRPVEPKIHATLIDLAQVHATLALAAATAMGAAVDDDLAGLTVEERDAWYAVAGTKPGADYEIKDSLA
jgi:hypothetical protein